ncbi:MAG: peptide ABC transporter substrate-binding protein [Clostridiales bacterium]|nr:peptide ABC transporter substrate-binding protein [Clostridiales bacterium]
MKKLIALLLCAVMLMSVVPAMAEDEKVTYTSLYSGEVTTLNYLVTSTANEYGLAANFIDTLVEYDEFGRMLPALAESWEPSNNATVWTFKLRQDATWVNGKGEVVAKVTANDFVAAAKYILNAANASATANLLYDDIVGAEAYYMGTTTPAEGEAAAPVMDWETVGVKALDDYTLQYTLTKSIPYFLTKLTYVCYMPVYEPFLNEMGENFGLATGNDTLLYCGAYYLSEFKPQELRVLSKNAANWDAGRVYIDEVVHKYNKEASKVSPQLYLEGEVDSASLDTETVASWLNDEEKAAKLHPVRQTGTYAYFYTFNFNPQFEAEYEPENWAIAVNSENFRLSIINAFNRIKIKTLIDPDNPEALLYNTLTPPAFVSDSTGLDYVNMGDLAAITAKGADTLNVDAALAYKDAAIKELTDAGCKFPVKVLIAYNPNASANNSAEEAQIVEQQLENVLGTDYIDIVLAAGPSQSYLTARRTGKYAIQNVNWGPDYIDPETYTDPFVRSVEDNGYNDMGMATDTALLDEYYALVEAAKAITDDIDARYLAFANAEAFLINHGFVMPIGYSSGGYTASLLDPFTAPIAADSMTQERYKGRKKLDDYMDTDEYYDAYDAYMEAKDALNAQ